MDFFSSFILFAFNYLAMKLKLALCRSDRLIRFEFQVDEEQADITQELKPWRRG